MLVFVCGFQESSSGLHVCRADTLHTELFPSPAMDSKPSSPCCKICPSALPLLFPRRQLELYTHMNGKWFSVTIINWFSVIPLTPVDPESILRKNEDRGLSLSNVKLYNKAVENKTVWYEPRTAGQCNTLESPDINTHVNWPSTWLSKTRVREGVRVLYLFVNFCLPACPCVYGNNFQELVLSFYPMGSRKQTQISRLGSRLPYPLIHLINLHDT